MGDYLHVAGSTGLGYPMRIAEGGWGVVGGGIGDREAETADANHDSDIAMRSLFTSILFKTISVPEKDLTESES